MNLTFSLPNNTRPTAAGNPLHLLHQAAGYNRERAGGPADPSDSCESISRGTCAHRGGTGEEGGEGV